MLFGKKQRRITRLLLVEDEPLVAFDTEHLLSDDNYEVVATVDRVADALAILADGVDVHLVLADVTLADGSGMDVARAAAAREVPVLFVTGGCPDGAQDVAAGVLAKPYGKRDLLAAIAAIEATMDGRRPKRMPSGLRLFDQVS